MKPKTVVTIAVMENHLEKPFNKSLSELERDFGADNPQVRQIREKRESFSRGSEVRA